MSEDKLKTRFAPSPTGYLHIGGARTALFNYLLARQKKGTFLLRIEDTDVAREKEKSYEKILEDMEWLGIKWDEGPIRQTQRLDIYKKYADILIEKGFAYPCYCTPEELREKSEAMLKQKITPRYDGTCRNLTPEQVDSLVKEGRTPCLRFRVPEERAVTVKDLVRGEVTYEPGFSGDFVIFKSDGTPAYNFAVVIDDHEMGVTLVMRGEEHLVNTPLQVLMYEALGLELPDFAHISMILAPDRSKLSKRHGTVAVGEYKDKGVLPEALVNYLALLGWNPGTDEEFFNMSQLVEKFRLYCVSRSPAVYDFEKLKWMTSQYIKEMNNSQLLENLKPFILETGLVNEVYINQNRETMLGIVKALKPRLSLLTDVKEEIKIFFADEFQLEEAARECMEWETTPAVFDAFIEVLEEMGAFNKQNFMQGVKEIQKRSNAKGKKLYMPLSVGITGQAHGVEMEYILTILTKEQMLKRLKAARQLIAARA